MSSGSDFRNQEEFKRGSAGEKLVAEWLRKRGWYVIPSYDYTGRDDDKAPKMTGSIAAYVLPDLDIAKNGKRLWAEVKTKSEATLHRKTNVLEHGISLRLFGHYKAVQAITGCAVHVLVFEENTRQLLFRPLGEVTEGRVYEGMKMGRSGMIFWPRDTFKLLGEI